jgi:hypothetical protein
LQQCNKGKLLLACRPTASPNYTLVAMAPRLDVTFDCGSNPGCVHDSNGVGWYFNDSYSWGFAPQGEPVQRSSCDTNNTQGDLRMCWHTGFASMNSGYRCGNNVLNGDPSWERAVFHAD